MTTIEKLKLMGFHDIRTIPGRGYTAIFKRPLTIDLCYGLDPTADLVYKGRYSYRNMQEAFNAIEKWDGEGDAPGEWIQHYFHTGFYGRFPNGSKVWWKLNPQGASSTLYEVLEQAGPGKVIVKAVNGMDRFALESQHLVAFGR